MPIEQLYLIDAHIRARLKRLSQTAQITVANLLDAQVTQETLDACVEAALLNELLPEPWNPTWDM